MGKIYLSPPHIGREERRLLHDAVESNWIAPLGPHVDRFEQEMARYIGVRSAAALSSGTGALHLALVLAGVRAGEPVLCSDFTFVASANPIRYVGAEPVFVDSEPASGNMCFDALDRACRELKSRGERPRVVVIVDLYGGSSDYKRLLPVCERHGLTIIEDAAEALGASAFGKKCGAFGRMSALSFNGNKILTSSGGGMLLSDDEELMVKARFLAQQARDPAPHYEHTEMGFNYRMSNLLAAVGRGQLAWLDERMARRREIFKRYREAFRDIAGISYFADPEVGASSRWLTVMMIDPKVGVTSEKVRTDLAARDIEARPAWKPMHRQKLFEGCRYFPHSPSRDVGDEFFARGLCLPSGSSMTDAEQDEVISVMRASFGRS